MTQAYITNTTKELIAHHANLPKDAVNPTLTIGHLMADSLEIVLLKHEIELKFDIIIDDTHLNKDTLVNELYTTIYSNEKFKN